MYIPTKILNRMRLNRNFANVYTPFHEFEDISEHQYDQRARKEKRKKRRDQRMDLFFNRAEQSLHEPSQMNINDAHGEYEINV